VEAGRIIQATEKAVLADPELLAEGDREGIRAAIQALHAASQGEDPARIHLLIEELDASSKGFATRRMNRAIARAIEGRKVDDVAGGLAAEGH
jgi:molecular chaperone HscA